jgi:hypothetical protein
MRQRLKHALELVLVPIAAAVVFLEQTLIRYLNMMMAAFARLPLVARLEAFLVRLPPGVAVLVFAAPSIFILPVKLAAFWLAVHRHFVLAFVAVALGKILATAVVARLYKILRPTLMSLRWFAWADRKFFQWRDWAYGFVRNLPAWRKAAETIERMRARLADLLSSQSAR